MKTINYTLDPNISDRLAPFFEAPEDVLFFDIETTGFSPRGASIYLIGCSFYRKDGWHVRQYFAETPAQEAEILRSFVSLAASFHTFVNFNGTTFDIPFIQAKCKKHALPVFSPEVRIDIYKSISPYKNLLHLPGCRQKQLEEFIGIFREDKFNGGQLIELYQAYQENQDERLLHVLLLHNCEDLIGMLQLYPIMAIPDLFENGKYRITDMRLQSCQDVKGSASKELLIRLALTCALPVSLSCHGSTDILKSCFLSGNDKTVLLKIPAALCELKYFFPDYKNYSYLPAEDYAIHKSVAAFVDKSRRIPAAAANCYVRKTGVFVPFFGCAPEEVKLFAPEYKSKQKWILAEELLNSAPQADPTCNASADSVPTASASSDNNSAGNMPTDSALTDNDLTDNALARTYVNGILTALYKNK